MTVTTNCGICESTELDRLWHLPNMPITECYGEFDANFPSFDQELLICNDCGHVELANKLPASDLYNINEYAYRTGEATNTPIRVTSFIDFCSPYIPEKCLSIVDIGGNDQSLLDNFSENVICKTLIDPIRVDQHGQTIRGVNILGKLIEDIHLDTDLSQAADIIFCTHTLEHITAYFSHF